jgi:hypothetical protein
VRGSAGRALRRSLRLTQRTATAMQTRSPPLRCSPATHNLHTQVALVKLKLTPKALWGDKTALTNLLRCEVVAVLNRVGWWAWGCVPLLA